MNRSGGPGTDPSTVAGKSENNLGGGEAVLENNPLRNVYPEDYRAGSQHPNNGGVSTSLATPPDRTGSAGVNGSDIIDPQDDYSYIVLGGLEMSGVTVDVYDTWQDEWNRTKYNDLHQDIGDVTDTAVLEGRPCLQVIDDTRIVLAGGLIDDTAQFPSGDNSTSRDSSRIFILDTSTGSWSEFGQELPEIDGLAAGTSQGGSASAEGLMYVYGASSSGSASAIQMIEIDIDGGTVTRLPDLPAGGVGNSGPSPIIDGEIYLHGEWDDDGSDGTLNVARFFKYDIASQTYTELQDVEDVFAWEGSTASGRFARGGMHEFNGNIIYVDGYRWFSELDIGFYNTEDDSWVARGPLRGQGDGSAPWEGAVTGVILNDVFYSAGTGQNPNNNWAYIPERKPFFE